MGKIEIKGITGPYMNIMKIVALIDQCATLDCTYKKKNPSNCILRIRQTKPQVVFLISNNERILTKSL